MADSTNTKPIKQRTVFSLTCPEVNGFLANLELVDQEYSLTDDDAAELTEQFAAHHDGCPHCEAASRAAAKEIN